MKTSIRLRDTSSSVFKIDCTSEITTLINRHGCKVLSFDFAEINQVPDEFLSLLVFLTKIPHLNLQLLNATATTQETLAQKGFGGIIEMRDIDVAPERHFWHFDVTESVGFVEQHARTPAAVAGNCCERPTATRTVARRVPSRDNRIFGPARNAAAKIKEIIRNRDLEETVAKFNLLQRELELVFREIASVVQNY